MKKIFLLLAISFASVSCLVDDEVENYAGSSNVIGFENESQFGSYVASGEVVDLNVPVLLVGGGQGLPMESDVTVTYALDASSTATEGLEFDFVNPSKTLVLEGGLTSALVPIKINTGNLETGVEGQKTIVLNLTTVSNGAVIASNMDQIVITLNGLCYSNLAGSYNLSVTRLSPAGGPYSFPNEILDQVADGVYNTTTTGNYDLTLLTSASDAGFTFTDVCGSLLMETQNLGSVYSNIVTQSPAQADASLVDEGTGVLTIEYSVWFTNNTVERTFRGVYTPN